jgi:putative iron-regulated protein
MCISLDNTIKNKIAVAKNALGAITLPFGEAIVQQPTQVQNAINAINDLKATLESDLLPLIQQRITN